MRLATYTTRKSPEPHLGLVLGEYVMNVRAAAQALGLGDVPDDMLEFIAAGEPALDVAREIDAPIAADAAAHALPLADVRLMAPIPRPRRNIVCIGLNYAEHVAESQSVAGSDAPKHPVFFTKPPSTVIRPDDEIAWHGHVSTAIDWEVELAVIIGREGRDIAEAHALEYVFGYTVANDVTARDLQGRHQQWYKGKGLDTFCPLGPSVLTADEVPDPQQLDLRLAVNGVEKQVSNTRFMIFPVARLIAEWSAGMTLFPGDILLTGTPSGVGIGRKPPEFLKPGDVMEAEVAPIGVLRNRVATG
jgi:2-keto-4-pentenoate hydratase/2-oxohepta-3-ene-1,7-dioic acid hydratase in catechol pathway